MSTSPQDHVDHKLLQRHLELPQLFVRAELQLRSSAESTHRSKNTENRGLCRQKQDLCCSFSSCARYREEGGCRQQWSPLAPALLRLPLPAQVLNTFREGAHGGTHPPVDIYLTLTPGK